MKEEFLKLLRTVNREGIESLIQFLEKSDFFIAPASTRFHGDHEGGLAEHSMKVYEILKHKVANNIPYGHGEKSVMMITEYIKLTPEEKYAIRWHMGYTEPKELYNSIGVAYTKYPIALLTHEADLEATYFYNI